MKTQFQSVTLIFTLVIVNLLTNKVCSIDLDLPSIVIHSRNPVFACQDVPIHVSVNDRINFVCPMVGVQSYVSSSDVYENLYFLDSDVEGYENCNATGARKLVTCDGSTNNALTVTIRPIPASGDIKFEEGKTYYLVGTGFHTQENVGNTIGGSCNATSENGRYQIKLKMYVCGQEEIKNGTCKLCQSEGCYYKDCLQSCSNWTTVSESTSNHTLLQRRTCVHSLLGIESEHYKTVAAPPLICTDWSIEFIKPSGEKCINFEKRECNSSLGNVYVDIKEEVYDCQANSPTGAPRTDSGNDDPETYKYVAVATSIFFFIVGLFFGAVCHRQYRKKQYRRTSIIGRNGGLGNVNEAYEQNSGYDQFDGDGNIHMTKIEPLPKEIHPVIN